MKTMMNTREKLLVIDINKKLGKYDNVAIYAPTLTVKDCERLKEIGKFTDVHKSFMGYVEFWRKAK